MDEHNAFFYTRIGMTNTTNFGYICRSMSSVLPYKGEEGSKKAQVTSMFDNIARHYDFLNIFLSMGIDRIWRRKVVNLLRPKQPEQILDIATGTGDLAIALRKTGAKKITGVDISAGMLELAQKKIKSKNLEDIISVQQADSENLPFQDNTFCAITVSFGIRNFQNPKTGLKEMYRTLKPGGTLAILEFSKPHKFPVRPLFNFYSKIFIPFVGRIISGDKRAYAYLPESVNAFPEGESFLRWVKNTGFKNVKQYRLSSGIATLYVGEKVKEFTN